MPTSFSVRSETAMAACFCGAASVTVPLPLRPPLHCHCGQCRRLSGAAWTTWVSVRQDSAALQGTEALHRFAATPNVTRHFCPRCGKHVFTSDARMPHILGIPAGLFPADAVPAARGHFFVSDKADWAVLPQGEPCFGGLTGMEPLKS